MHLKISCCLDEVELFPAWFAFLRPVTGGHCQPESTGAHFSEILLDCAGVVNLDHRICRRDRVGVSIQIPRKFSPLPIIKEEV